MPPIEPILTGNDVARLLALYPPVSQRVSQLLEEVRRATPTQDGSMENERGTPDGQGSALSEEMIKEFEDIYFEWRMEANNCEALELGGIGHWRALVEPMFAWAKRCQTIPD